VRAEPWKRRKIQPRTSPALQWVVRGQENPRYRMPRRASISGAVALGKRLRLRICEHRAALSLRRAPRSPALQDMPEKTRSYSRDVMERTRTPLTVWFWGAYLLPA